MLFVKILENAIKTKFSVQLNRTSAQEINTNSRLSIKINKPTTLWRHVLDILGTHIELYFQVAAGMHTVQTTIQFLLQHIQVFIF